MIPLNVLQKAIFMSKNDDLDNSFQSDKRGEIRRFDVNGVKFNVLFTKAGALRSGDVHPIKQFDIVFSGEVEITIRKDDKDITTKKGPNDFIVIEPNTPHLFRFTKDTVMMEWWDGPFQVEYYQPYRKFVEEWFEKNKR